MRFYTTRTKTMLYFCSGIKVLINLLILPRPPLLTLPWHESLLAESHPIYRGAFDKGALTNLFIDKCSSLWAVQSLGYGDSFSAALPEVLTPKMKLVVPRSSIKEQFSRPHNISRAEWTKRSGGIVFEGSIMLSLAISIIIQLTGDGRRKIYQLEVIILF